MPEADRQQGGGQQGDAAVGQHLAAEPIGGGDGEQAEEGGGEAQGEEGVAQSAGHGPGDVEVERLAAGEGGDEDRPVAAQADVPGVEAVGGFVVVDAGGDGCQVGQAQGRGHEQGQDHEGQRMVAREAGHMREDCSRNYELWITNEEGGSELVSRISYDEIVGGLSGGAAECGGG